MRWIASLAVVILAATCGRTEEEAYYIKCRIWNNIPRVGPLHHACVVFCKPGQHPYCIDENGKMVGNPKLTYWGSRPGRPGFSPEKPPIVEITVIKIDLPASVVRGRMAGYDGDWTIVKNCQVAAKWATEPGPSIWNVVMRR